MSARSAVVLAGGRSVRMGRDKVFETVDAEPALQRVVRIVGEVCPTVVVVGAPGRPLPTLPSGARRVDDPVEHRDEGPLRGLVTGLAALEPSPASVAYLGGCDQIAVTTAHVELVVATLEADAELDAVVPADDEGRLHPLGAAVRVGPALAAWRTALDTGVRAVHAALARLRVHRLPASALPDPRILRPTNTPAQWSAALDPEPR